MLFAETVPGPAMSRSFASSCRTCSAHWSGSSSAATAIATDSSSTPRMPPMASASSIRVGRTAMTPSTTRMAARSTGSIALVEVQGYVFAAYRWLADVVARHGDAPGRRSCGTGRQIRAWSRIASGCRRRTITPRRSTGRSGRWRRSLQSRPPPVLRPPRPRGRLVAARLRQPDLDSGWGIRTSTPACRPTTR